MQDGFYATLQKGNNEEHDAIISLHHPTNCHIKCPDSKRDSSSNVVKDDYLIMHFY